MTVPASGHAEDSGGIVPPPAFYLNPILNAGLSSSLGQHRTVARRRGSVARRDASPAGRVTGLQVLAGKKIWRAGAAA